MIPNFFTSIQCSIIMYISPQFYDITRCLWHVNHVSQEHELECKKRCFLCSFVFKIRWKVCHRVRTPQKIDKHTEIVNHCIFCVVWKILSIEFHIYIGIALYHITYYLNQVIWYHIMLECSIFVRDKKLARNVCCTKIFMQEAGSNAFCIWQDTVTRKSYKK